MDNCEENIKNNNHESIKLNCKDVLKVLDDLSMDVFFTQNPIPTILRYPNIETFKSGFISMNEKIYKNLKEKREEQYLKSVEHRESEILYKFEHNFKKNYLAVLDKRKVSRKIKDEIRKSAIKYCHSQAIIRLLKGYFALIEYHYPVHNTYPQIMDQYLKTIFAVFSSLKREKVEKMLKDICSSKKMHDFYRELYDLWEQEGNNIEREVVFGTSEK